MDLHTPTITTAPVHAATVVLLREGVSGPEVLLLQRHGASPVLGGAHVFPGGKVDVQDAQLLPLANQDATSLQAAWQAAEAITEEAKTESRGAPAVTSYLAALRETFEEAGLLYARSASTDASISTATLQAVRERQHAGEPLAQTLQALHLRLHTRALHPWARWITPVQGAVSSRRFDTRFFIAALPPGQEPVVDAHEATQALWLRPRDALAQYAQGQLSLAPPQIMSLVQLLPHRDVSSALVAAQAQPPVLIQPEAHTDTEGVLMHCYPGDALHSERRPLLWGPTRLLYRGQHFEPPEGWARFGPP